MMRLIGAIALVLMLATGWLSPASAEVNVEGVSGILAVPTAAVVNDGEAVFSAGRYYSDTLSGDTDYVARTYNATVGYLPNLEIVARFVDFPERPDSMGATNYADRSVSAKYRLFKNRDWSLAVGAMDIGGQSKRNESVYGVVDYHGIPQVTLTAGGGTEKYEGVFGGLRWTPVKWASLLGEYDSRNVNYGVEFRPVKGLTLRTGIINDHSAFTASYAFPMDSRGKDTPCCPQELSRCDVEYADACEQAAAIRDALVAESFENVVVGISGETVFVDYENRRFSSQLDALGVTVARAVQLSDARITRLVVTPKLDDVPQLSLDADVEALLAFLANPGQPPAGISVTPYFTGQYPPDTVFVEEGNKKPGGGEIQLRLIHAFEITRPGEPTFASKTGLGLEERLYTGRGTSLRFRQDWPAHNDLTDKTDPYNRDALLHYLNNLNPNTYLLASAGYYGGETYGGMAQAAHYFNEGRYRIGGRFGYTVDESPGEDDPDDSEALGELAYYEPSLDWEVTALGGQFMEGDQGLRLESTRYFGSTALTFFAYDTDDSEAHGGFRIFVPLPWYSEARHDDWRAVGSPDFAFQYRTDSDPSARVLQPGVDISTVRGQLKPEYVGAHLDDLRRAIALYSCL
ncbi:YjbH domain-containing protein [bacterium]|nr:YjbH domain-containing protein [bacterium]